MERMFKFAGVALASALVFALSACNPTPEVGSVEPTSGPETGGMSKVKGKNFKQGAKITINNTPVAGTKFESATVLSAELPPAAPGTVKIGVLNPPDKPSVKTASYEYKDATPPMVQSFEPSGDLPAETEQTAVTVTYSEPLSEGTISVKDADGNEVAGTTAVTDTALTFTANEKLPAGKAYTVYVTGAKDAAGNAAEDATNSFSIAAPAKGKKK
jgi:hypothetical protein